MADKLLARIRPGKKGFKVKRYMYQGTLYVADRGWYEVGEGTADKLRVLRQDDQDPDSPFLFDVVTREDAVKIEEEEADIAHKAPATRPNRVMSPGRRVQTQRQKESGDLSTADLPGHEPPQTPQMLDPDPEGADLKGPDELDGIAPIGRVTEDPVPRRRSVDPKPAQGGHSRR